MASPPPAALGVGKAASHCSRLFEGLGGDGESGLWRTRQAKRRDPCRRRQALSAGSTEPGAAVLPPPPGRGPSLSAAPFRRRKAWNTGFFLRASPSQPVVCLNRGGGVGALCAESPFRLGCRSPGSRGGAPRRRGFPAGCGETPLGENIPGVLPACPRGRICCFLNREVVLEESWGEGVSGLVSAGSFAL